MQDNHVICYESRKLKEHAHNYATHDLKLATMVHALKMWRHYLMDRRFELKEHANNYATHDLELAAIVTALKMWRHYLMGGIFELRTDHCGLKYLFDQPTLNARKARWL